MGCYSYGWRHGLLDERVVITPEQCRKAHIDGEFRYYSHFFKVEPHGETLQSWYSEGYLDTNNNCYPSTFVRGGRTYEKSYEVTVGKLQVTPFKGTYDPATGQVVFSNGVTANYMDKVTTDNRFGTMVWDAQGTPCHNRLSTIYNGTALLYKHKRNQRSNPEDDDIVLVDNSLQKRYAGFIIKGRGKACQVPVYHTQLPELQILVMTEGETPLDVPFQPQFKLRNVNLHSNVAFLHFTQSMHVEERFFSMTKLICENERMALSTTLALVSDNNPFALIAHFGPGHLINRAGSVAYLSRCVPKMGHIRSFKNCTQEIPIVLQNSPAFVDPLTRIVQPIPTIKRCDGITPVRWRMETTKGKHVWVCANPTITPCLPPEQMQPQSDNPEWVSHHDFTEGAGQGIVSDDMIHQHEQSMTDALTRPAMDSTIIGSVRDRILGMTESGIGGMLTFYGPAEIESITQLVGTSLIPFYNLVGEWWSTLMGILVILSLVKMVAGFFIRIYVGYRHKGCGWWVILSAVDTAFMVLTIPIRLLAAAANDVTDPLFRRDRRHSGGDGAEGESSPLHNQGSSAGSSDFRPKSSLAPPVPGTSKQGATNETDEAEEHEMVPVNASPGPSPYKAVTKKLKRYVGDQRFQVLDSKMSRIEDQNTQLTHQISSLIDLQTASSGDADASANGTLAASAPDDDAPPTAPRTIEEAAAMAAGTTTSPPR